MFLSHVFFFPFLFIVFSLPFSENIPLGGASCAARGAGEQREREIKRFRRLEGEREERDRKDGRKTLDG